MGKTSSVGHPYPDRRDRPHYDRLVSFFESVDQEGFANRDQWNLSFVPKGGISVSSSGEVTWSDELVIHHGSTGRSGVIPASNASGPVLGDGDMFYADVVRGPQGQYTPDTNVSSGNVPNSRKSIVLFYRNGDLLWIRQTGVIKLGKNLGAGGSGLVKSGDVIRDNKRMASREVIGVGSQLIGRFSFKGDDYELDNAAKFEIELAVEAAVTDDGQTGEVTLYDDTAKSLVETLSFSSDQPSRKSSVLSLIDPSDFRPYELRAGMNSGQTGDLQVFDANLQFRNEF